MKPTAWSAKLWKASVKQFHEFLSPLVAGLGRSERRVAAARYVEGLLMPGARKSIIPMAERLGVDSQSLQQFVTDSPWSEEALWRAKREAEDTVGPKHWRMQWTFSRAISWMAPTMSGSSTSASGSVRATWRPSNALPRCSRRAALTLGRSSTRSGFSVSTRSARGPLGSSCGCMTRVGTGPGPCAETNGLGGRSGGEPPTAVLGQLGGAVVRVDGTAEV